MTALPILRVSGLVGWLPSLPSITHSSSEKQRPSITGPNSIRQGLVPNLGLVFHQILVCS